MGDRGRPKAELVLSTEERLALDRLGNWRKSAQAKAMRARIVLCCAKGGATNQEVAKRARSERGDGPLCVDLDLPSS
jgi:hypothetical protein